MRIQATYQNASALRLLAVVISIGTLALINDMSNQTQQAFLQTVKAEIDLTWDELAALADIAPRALKTYGMPDTSKDYRVMPKLARNALLAVLENHRNKKKVVETDAKTD